MELFHVSVQVSKKKKKILSFCKIGYQTVKKIWYNMVWEMTEWDVHNDILPKRGVQVLCHKNKSLKKKLIIVFHRLISARSLISAFSMGVLSLVPPPVSAVQAYFVERKLGGRSVILETTEASCLPLSIDSPPCSRSSEDCSWPLHTAYKKHTGPTSRW